jgi:signal transduction histidine kinase
MDSGEALNVPVVEQSSAPWQSALSVAQTLHDYRDELHRLTGRLLTIQEDERRRIALDLHDGLGQSLSLIKLSLENTVDEIALGAVEQAGHSLRQLIAQVGEALGEVRRVATALRPSILDDLGILPALSWFFRDFEAACRHLAVEKVFNVAEHEVPAPLQITIFRIIQEATHNVVKHADAARLRISLDFVDRKLCLLIEDDGNGFDALQALTNTGSGLGLFSMQQRAVLSGGSFHLTSAPGAGTRIEVIWPSAAVIG